VHQQNINRTIDRIFKKEILTVLEVIMYLIVKCMLSPPFRIVCGGFQKSKLFVLAVNKEENTSQCMKHIKHFAREYIDISAYKEINDPLPTFIFDTLRE